MVPLLATAFLVVTTVVPMAAKGVLLMNRIGPSKVELFVANVNGTDERRLFSTAGLDYNASFSPDGKWIVFTSERNGQGQADIYRVHPDGSGLERLTDSPSVDDQAALSPDASQLVFVSTREMHTANIWILDLHTRKARNLTGGQTCRRPVNRTASSGPPGRLTASGSRSAPIAARPTPGTNVARGPATRKSSDSM